MSLEPLGPALRRAVCALADWRLDPKERSDACASVPELEQLDSLAERHGVRPMLAATMLGEPTGPLARTRSPIALWELWRQLREEAVTVDRAGWLILADLLDAHRARGVEVLVLKGPVLTERFCADPAARPARDIDLLVRERDLSAAEELLVARGYRCDRREYYRAGHFHLPYHHLQRDIGGCIELHWDLTPRDYPVRFDVDDAFSRARAVELRAGAALALPFDLELAHLAWTSLHDGAARLRELGDVAAAWDSATPAVRCSAFDRAEAAGAGIHLAESLRLASCYFARLHLTPPTEPPSSRFRRRLKRRAFHPAHVLREGLGGWWAYRHWGHFVLLPPARAGWRYLWRRARGTGGGALSDLVQLAAAALVLLLSTRRALAHRTSS